MMKNLQRKFLVCKVPPVVIRFCVGRLLNYQVKKAKILTSHEAAPLLCQLSKRVCFQLFKKNQLLRPIFLQHKGKENCPMLRGKF